MSYDDADHSISRCRVYSRVFRLRGQVLGVQTAVLFGVRTHLVLLASGIIYARRYRRLVFEAKPDVTTHAVHRDAA